MISEHGPIRRDEKGGVAAGRRPYVEPSALEVRLVGCPGCGYPAELIPHRRLASTHGPSEPVEVRCIQRHRYVLPGGQVPGFRA